MSVHPTFERSSPSSPQGYWRLMPDGRPVGTIKGSRIATWQRKTGEFTNEKWGLRWILPVTNGD